jgi:hypothetical protein
VKRFLDLAELARDEVVDLLALAERLQRAPEPHALAGKVLGLLFLNPSLRTLASFTTAAKGRVKLEVRDPMQAIDRLARHRGLYAADAAEKVALTVNQAMGFNLSCLSIDELDTFERLAAKATANAEINGNVGNGARERIAEEIEPAAKNAFPG